ncbi:2-octaprenyl-6-methoxyphenyl hydroxylase [Vibrio algicola]|uniref:2-octaprenyl-6-methoxyphenyl hydroxylase n=1 Tax=Vibrio algicola TaxID=2662262 RepID=A0A5Q0THK8_9VIBR|nr:2-octaprenyl-6-methoxyphenyl hydroxylase [Vibrio algicola]
MKQYDVVIVGAGMAGSTLALALHRLCHGKLSIAVIEAHPVNSEQHPGFDARAIALSYGTANILKTLGLWDKFSAITTAITDIQVSDRGHLGFTDIDAKSQGVDALGYVVELADVGRLYQAELNNTELNNTELNHAAIDYFCPAQVKRIERSVEQVVIELNDGNHLQAKLLVAADGALSQSCKLLDIELNEVDFEQHAVIVNVSTQLPPNGKAFERFTSSGPLAFLPMSDQRSSVVWCLPPQQAEQILALDEQAFTQALQQQFGWRLGAITKVGVRASYPLLLRYRESVISHRFAVVGNAAQTLHPIAGQGFNLGIRDVMSLAESITQAFEQGQDIGAYTVLSQYRQSREQDRNQTMSLTSSLVNIFSNDWLSLRVGRNLALMAMGNLSCIKQPIVKRTMGLVER